MSVDVRHVDLQSLISGDVRLKRAARTNGGELMGACPVCGGKDRLRVWPHPTDGHPPRFWCRHCGLHGNALDYMMKVRGLQFVEACQALGVRLDDHPPQQRITPPPARPRAIAAASPASSMRTDYACFDPAWQAAAAAFIDEAADALESHEGERARAYLAARGLMKTPAGWRLGFNDQPLNAKWGSTDVYLPRGIVIPWFGSDGLIWRIRVRRPPQEAQKQKYAQAAGAANGLYLTRRPVRPDSVIVLVEGEFDALAIIEHCEPLGAVIPIATGGTMNGHLAGWVGMLALARRVLVAFDQDINGAGEQAARWWLDALPNARRWAPTEHDVTDMIKAGHDVFEWIWNGCEMESVR